ILQCSVSMPNDDNFSLEWRKHRKLVFSAYGNASGHAAPEMQGRLARGSGLQLIIHSVQPDDEALYQCSVAAFTRGAFSRPVQGDQIKLVVNSVPRIRNNRPKEEFRPEGSAFHIDCEADGAPPPEVSWIKDDKIVSTNGTLHIERISASDQGKYECVAINSEGRDSLLTFLHFSREAIIDFAPSNKTVIENSSLFWHCSANGYPSNISYNWFYNDIPIKAAEVGLRAVIQGGDLGIRSVQRSDGGRYRCEATNGMTASASATAYLDVQYAPQPSSSNSEIYLLGKGLNSSLECNFDSNPPPMFVVWTHNGVLLPKAETARLALYNISDKDSGLYSCQAFNLVGSSRPFEMHVAVATPPRFSPSPPPAIFANVESNVEVTCDGYGDPSPIQYWLRNKTKVESSVLRINSVSHADHGIYECVLSSPVATLATQMILYVQNTYPQTVSDITASCGSENGHLQLHWKPGYDGGSEQYFNVFHRADGEEVWHSTRGTHFSSASIRDLQPFTLYHLKVESNNIHGAINSSAVAFTACSQLKAPSNLRMNTANSLEWDKVEGATAYRVQYRSSESANFSDMLDTASTSVSLNYATPNTAPWMDVRVSSLRPPSVISQPSHPLRFHLTKPNMELMLALGIFGTILALVLLLALIWLIRRRFLKRKTKHIQQIPIYCECRSVKNAANEPSLKYATSRNHCEWSTRDRIVEKRCSDGELPLLSDTYYDINYANGSRLQSLEMHSKTGSVINDMLREKYFGDKTEPRLDLLDQLRVERLKNEFRQSLL
uniref:Ig-like domain-containing protein n=1 Tax=Parascaris univalens TaxID=6257 RepID=A0A915A560_PARUN